MTECPFSAARMNQVGETVKDTQGALEKMQRNECNGPDGVQSDGFRPLEGILNKLICIRLQVPSAKVDQVLNWKASAVVVVQQGGSRKQVVLGDRWGNPCASTP